MNLENDIVGESESSSAKAIKSEEKKEPSSVAAEFLQQFEQEATVEGKIRLSIDFMRAALTKSGTPCFKDFWEGRRLCLPLFKENLSPKVRSQLWSDYIELSGEAKRLKEILDEQSAFAVEQIELAIQGFERDLEHYDVLLSQTPAVDISDACVTLKENKERYELLQKELNLLNTLAVRINALRKEVIKTDMRIRIKNKLLERLSSCGDRIFPRRKDLIKEISQEFVSDIEKFIQVHFQTEEFHTLPLYALREEIKDLQSIAKVLTLNTHAFTQTRLKLSECWDKIKTKEKERKKEVQYKRQVFKENYDLVMEKITPFAEACQKEITSEECLKMASEILEYMRTLELGREEVRVLREEIGKAKSTVLDRSRLKEQERLKKEQELEMERREKIQALKEALNHLLHSSEPQTIEMLIAKKEELMKEFEILSLSKAEKQIIDRLFKQVKDFIDEKREKALIVLSDDDLKSLEGLKGMLEERKQRRQEIKSQIAQYRKVLGGSGFDFEKAMTYREMIETEKASLDKINTSIEEIEQKIEEIEG